MAKDKIERLIEDSKKALSADYDAFERSIKEDLASFKKSTLDRI